MFKLGYNSPQLKHKHSSKSVNMYILCSFAPENLVSRDGFGGPVPRQPAHSILRLNLVLTYGIPPEFRGGVHLFILHRHTPSGQSRVYWVTQLRTDSVHCREPAGTRTSSNSQGSSSIECCLFRYCIAHHGSIKVRPLFFPHPLLVL